MTFSEKVRSMSAKEIVLTMVTALRQPCVLIEMSTFGGVIEQYGKKQCFGCAATNVICQIAGIQFDTTTIVSVETRAKAVNTNENFLVRFETAIDYLRKGFIYDYNDQAYNIGIAKIPEPTKGTYLPYLENAYTSDDLTLWEAFANTL